MAILFLSFLSIRISHSVRQKYTRTLDGRWIMPAKRPEPRATYAVDKNRGNGERQARTEAHPDAECTFQVIRNMRHCRAPRLGVTLRNFLLHRKFLFSN